MRCAECRFWEDMRENLVDGGRVGQCRRFAPRPVIGDSVSIIPGCVWLETDPDDWCGEFQA